MNPPPELGVVNDFTPGMAPSEPLVLSPGAPLISAREFVRRCHTFDGIRTIHHHRGSFHLWTGTHYPEADGAALRAELYNFLETASQPTTEQKPAPFNPSRNKVADVLDALAAASNLPASVQAPAWLGDATDLPPEELIACRNGLLHLPTGTLLPHSPEFFTFNALDFDFVADAPAPQEWMRFLVSLWDGETDIERRAAIENIGTLQEIFGYCLSADTRQQKAFLAVGPKRSGKGTIARTLTRLAGPENVAGPTLASLGQNFGLAPLIGKRLAIISDARLGSHADQQAITERLLSISGEDALTIDRKHRAAWTGRLAVRFLILSNELPRLADASGALASRFIVLMMTRSFYGHEDHGLDARLGQELPGILNWAIAGWQRLHARGYFVPPSSSTEAVQEFEDLASPISAFIRERCVIGAGYSVTADDLFHAWADWCKARGRDRPGSAQTFGRDLRAAIPGLRIRNLRDGDDRQRAYEGIGLAF